MNKNDYIIRLERKVENIVRETFWNVYRPGCSEHYVIHVLIEGNIDFYGKSGFDYASKFGIRYHDWPEDEDAPFFLCKELVPGYLDDLTGVYHTPKGYYVDDVDVEEFDK